MRLFCANCTHHFTHGLVYPIWMPKRDSHSNSLLLSHCLPFGSLTTVYFLWFYVCISLNEYHRSSLLAHPFTYRRQQQWRWRRQRYYNLTVQCFVCWWEHTQPQHLLVTDFHFIVLHMHRHPHAFGCRISKLPLYLPLTHKYTCLNAIIFRLLNSTIRFSLSLSCSGLCMSLCVRLMYINTISGPLAYNADRRTEPYTTAALRKDLKRFVVTILRMK